MNQNKKIIICAFDEMSFREVVQLKRDGFNVVLDEDVYFIWKDSDPFIIGDKT